MASKPPLSGRTESRPRTILSCEEARARATSAPSGRRAGKPRHADDDDEDEEDDELELDDDDDDEDLVVFTAQEAAGALATIFGFVKPFLSNYKKMLIFVGFGVLVETLFNVIMPLSLKFLIDDALGEEDFQALYKILGVLAVAGIVTSIVAVWYERWDARLAASMIADVRDAPVRARPEPAGGLFRAAPSAAKSCRASRSTSRPSKARSRLLPTARRCRSSS